jgi:hypothetical protein
MCHTAARVASGPKAAGLRVGSRVGVLVDGARSLHLYVDGEDQGVAATNLSQPCYPLFDLCYVSQVCACVIPHRKSILLADPTYQGFRHSSVVSKLRNLPGLSLRMFSVL